MLLDDTGGEGGMRKEGRHVKMVVSLDEDIKWGEVRPAYKKKNTTQTVSWLRLLLYPLALWHLKPVVFLRHRRAGLAIF